MTHTTDGAIDVAASFGTRRQGVRDGVTDYLDGALYGTAFVNLTFEQFGDVSEAYLAGYLAGWMREQ